MDRLYTRRNKFRGYKIVHPSFNGFYGHPKGITSEFKYLTFFLEDYKVMRKPHDQASTQYTI